MLCLEPPLDAPGSHPPGRCEAHGADLGPSRQLASWHLVPYACPCASMCLLIQRAVRCASLPQMRTSTRICGRRYRSCS